MTRSTTSQPIPGPWSSDETDEAWFDCREVHSELDAISEFAQMEVGSNAIENGLAVYVTGPHDTYHVVPDNRVIYAAPAIDEVHEHGSIVNTEDWEGVPASWEQVEVWHVRACHPDTIVRRDARREGARGERERILQLLRSSSEQCIAYHDHDLLGLDVGEAEIAASYIEATALRAERGTQ